eukprot:GAHX01001123.1.p1 GENE.GAHX01001123.1~~GAHX01001123.1.p1  ORF type:complete len:414 (+),score=91.34 GAHX01001123.1:45-1286(+)
MVTSSAIRRKLDVIIEEIKLKHNGLRCEFEEPIKTSQAPSSDIPEKTSLILKMLNLQNLLIHRKEQINKVTTDFENKLKAKIEESFSYKIELDQLRSEIDLIRKSESIWKKRFEQTSLKLYDEKLAILTEDLNRSRKEVNKLSLSYSQVKAEKNHESLIMEDKIKSLSDFIDSLKNDQIKQTDQINALKTDKEKMLQDHYNSASNLQQLTTSKNEQERIIADLTRKLTTERIESAAKIKKIEHSMSTLKANFEKSLNTTNGETESLKTENNELQHKMSLQQIKLDKLTKTLSCSNENLIKIQTQESELENKLFQITEKYKESQDIIKDSKERNRFLAIGLKKCIEEGKLYREQIIKLDQKLNGKPISELTKLNTSINPVSRRDKILSPYSKLSRQNVIGTPTKLGFDSTNNPK